jgi:hypothetical protein
LPGGSRGLGDVYKRQLCPSAQACKTSLLPLILKYMVAK